MPRGKVRARPPWWTPSKSDAAAGFGDGVDSFTRVPKTLRLEQGVFGARLGRDRRSWSGQSSAGGHGMKNGEAAGGFEGRIRPRTFYARTGRRVPLVSIVVPARNAARFLAATLQSIEEQTFPRWECLVMDDGSTDETFHIGKSFARRDKRFRIFRHPCMGKSRSRNEGFFLMHRGSRYVSFMDADDMWQPRALEMLTSRLEFSPLAVGVHGLAELIGLRGEGIRPGAFADFGRSRRVFIGGDERALKPEEPTTLESLAWVATVFPPGVLLARRENYMRGALYDPELLHCEDWDVSIRLSRQGPLEFLNEVILGYRRHDRNQSNDWNGMRAFVRKVHYKTFHSEANSPAQRQMLREGWRAFQLFKIREKWKCVLQQSGLMRWKALARALAAAPVHGSRYCRGSPPARWRLT